MSTAYDTNYSLAWLQHQSLLHFIMLYTLNEGLPVAACEVKIAYHISLATQRSVLKGMDPAHDQSHTRVHFGAKELQACLDQASLPGLPSYRCERQHIECVTGNTSSFLPVSAQNPVGMERLDTRLCLRAQGWLQTSGIVRLSTSTWQVPCRLASGPQPGGTSPPNIRMLLPLAHANVMPGLQGWLQTGGIA